MPFRDLAPELYSAMGDLTESRSHHTVELHKSFLDRRIAHPRVDGHEDAAETAEQSKNAVAVGSTSRLWGSP